MTPIFFKPARSPKSPYVWAVVVLTLIGALLVTAILLIRPQADAMDVIGKVLTGLTPTIMGTLAYLKSQETHLMVNSRLDAFITAQAQLARSQGQIQGVADEQARVVIEKAAAKAELPPIQP